MTETAKNYIAEKGYDSNFGARPLKRAIQKYLEDPIAEEILKGELKSGETILVDYDDDKKEIVVSAAKDQKRR
ncbi:Chaperone protein ClpB [Sphingobacterium daejeonense]|nr:Chaperone protein ClpB [Sphingobacterium daejeonense]